MELIAIVIIAAVLSHVVETVRDEHGHVRGTSRDALAKANPGRSKDWVKRHAAARTLRWWGHELIRGFPTIRGNYQADRDHVKLLRTRGEADRFRTRAGLLEELRRAKKERDEAAAEHERQRDIDQPQPAEDSPEPPAEPEPEPDEGVAEPPPGERLLPGQFLQPYPPLNDAQRQRDLDGKGNACAACGWPGTEDDPLVVTQDGYRVHSSHITDPSDGYYGQQHLEAVPDSEGAGPGAPQQPEGDNDMPTGTTTDAPQGNGITGEAGGYEAALAQTNALQQLGSDLVSKLETYQSELITNAGLGADTAATSSLDQAMEGAQQLAAGMAAHQQALAAHEPGHEYATSVAAPAHTPWLKSA